MYPDVFVQIIPLERICEVRRKGETDMYRVHYQEQNDKMSEQVRLWMLESVSTEVEEQTLTMEERRTFGEGDVSNV